MVMAWDGSFQFSRLVILLIAKDKRFLYQAKTFVTLVLQHLAVVCLFPLLFIRESLTYGGCCKRGLVIRFIFTCIEL